MRVLELCVKAAEEYGNWGRAHTLIVDDMMSCFISKSCHEVLHQYECGLISLVEMCDRIALIRKYWYFCRP